MKKPWNIPQVSILFQIEKAVSRGKVIFAPTFYEESPLPLALSPTNIWKSIFQNWNMISFMDEGRCLIHSETVYSKHWNGFVCPCLWRGLISLAWKHLWCSAEASKPTSPKFLLFTLSSRGPKLPYYCFPTPKFESTLLCFCFPQWVQFFYYVLYNFYFTYLNSQHSSLFIIVTK